MRDHLSHCAWPINAGMWGGVHGALRVRLINALLLSICFFREFCSYFSPSSKLPNLNRKDMQGQLKSWIHHDGVEARYFQDQRFLREVIWPQISPQHIARDSYCCQLFPRCHPFPSRRSNDFQHVGQVFLGDGKPRQGDIDILVGEKAPEVCRLHPDWEYG